MVQYQEGTGANCRLPLNPPFFGEFTKPYVGTPGLDERRLRRRRPTSRTSSSAPGRPTSGRSSPTSGTSSWSGSSRTRTSLSVGYVGSRSEPRRRVPRLQPGRCPASAIPRPGRPTRSGGGSPPPASPAPCATPRPTRSRQLRRPAGRACVAAARTASSSSPPTPSARRSATTRASTVPAGAATAPTRRTPAWAATATTTRTTCSSTTARSGSRRKHNLSAVAAPTSCRSARAATIGTRLERRHRRRCSAAGTSARS